MRRYAFCGLILTLAGCGPSVGSGEHDISSGASTSSTVTTGDVTVTSTSGSLASTSTSGSSTFSPTSEATGSTGPIGEVCPEPEPGGDAIGGIYSFDPQAGAAKEVECEAQDWATREANGVTERVVTLECSPVEGGAPHAVELVVTAEMVDPELQALVGQAGLQLSYFHEGFDMLGDPSRSRFALRDLDGQLLVLSNYLGQDQTEDSLVAEVDVGNIWYLGDEPRKQAAWNDPFGEMFIRDVGCAQRPGTRPYVATEIPWALQFDSDEGPQSLYDQSMGSVNVEGSLSSSSSPLPTTALMPETVASLEIEAFAPTSSSSAPSRADDFDQAAAGRLCGFSADGSGRLRARSLRKTMRRVAGQVSV